MAALIASSFLVRSVSLIPVRSSSGGDQGRVDGDDVVGLLGLDCESRLLGLLGPADLADEDLAAGGGRHPDGPVAGLVGGLRASSGVTHPGERTLGGLPGEVLGTGTSLDRALMCSRPQRPPRGDGQLCRT